MRSFRNNNKRPRSRYRNNGDRSFKRNNGDAQSFVSASNFQRKAPGRNNHNASKLIEKYTDLAREALSNGDKILSENYFQHADHFIRIQGEKEKNRIVQSSLNKTSNENENKVEVEESQEKKSISN